MTRNISLPGASEIENITFNSNNFGSIDGFIKELQAIVIVVESMEKIMLTNEQIKIKWPTITSYFTYTKVDFTKKNV